MIRPSRLLLLLAALPLLACGGGTDSTGPDSQGVMFAFRLRNQPASEEFRAVISSPSAIATARAQLALPAASRKLFPNGPIAAGNGGHNLSWGWHYTSVDFAELSIELCDGSPTLVQADLGYWLNTVKRFCPWSAYVHAEIR